MPRPKAAFPAYCIHKRSNRAYVTLDGKQVPLGEANTPQSRAEYDRVLAEWLAHGRTLTTPAEPAARADRPTVSILIDAFWTHAQSYYTKPVRDDAGQPMKDAQGKEIRQPSEQLDHFRQVLRPLRRMYGAMPTDEFSCLQLEALRSAMILPHQGSDGRTRPGWSRRHANRQITRIRRVFAWGVTKELVPVDVHSKLCLLDGLRKGTTPARETPKVRPVDRARALQIIPFVSRQVATMIQVQLAAAMRSTEVCIMRPCDIERVGDRWTYTPSFHKTEDHDIVRRIPLGKRARALIAPFLKDRSPDAFLFSPAEADAERKAKAANARKTKVQPSQVLRAAEDRKNRHKRKRLPGARYTQDSYWRAIRYGCELAYGMPLEFRARAKDTPEQRREKNALRAKWNQANSWHPHQLRHAGATAIASRDNAEAAQIQLGHTTQKTTLIYIEPDVEKARKVVEKVG